MTRKETVLFKPFVICSLGALLLAEPVLSCMSPPPVEPPWSWDDGWDQVPIFVWHFFPSYAFASHSGAQLSHDYEWNTPVAAVFAMPPAALLARLRLQVTLREGDKWGDLEERGRISHRTYWQALEWKLKAYLNYLWHALG